MAIPFVLLPHFFIAIRPIALCLFIILLAPSFANSETTWVCYSLKDTFKNLNHRYTAPPLLHAWTDDVSLGTIRLRGQRWRTHFHLNGTDSNWSLEENGVNIHMVIDIHGFGYTDSFTLEDADSRELTASFHCKRYP